MLKIKEIRFRPQLHFVLSFVVTAVLFGVVFSDLTTKDFMTLVAGIDRQMLVTYFGLSIIGLAARTWRYQLMLSGTLGQESTPTYWKLLVVSTVRNALVDLLPARVGELSYLYMTRRYQVPLVSGIATLGLGIVFDLVVLAGVIFCFLFSSLFFTFGEQPSLVFEISPHVVLLLSGGMFVLLVVLVRCLAPLLCVVGERLLKSTSQKNLGEKFRQIGMAVRALVHSGYLLPVVFSTLLLRVAKYGALYFLLLAIVKQWNLGFHELGVVGVISAFILAEASAMLPVSGLMGFGAYEGTWNAVFGLVCGEACKHVPTFTVGFMVHVITQIFAYSLGAVAVFVFYLTTKLGNSTDSKHQ